MTADLPLPENAIQAAARPGRKVVPAMSRVRYETFCDGRLLKVTPMMYAGRIAAEADGPAFGGPYIADRHWWVIDEQRVADDVAQAMLAAYQAWESAVPAEHREREQARGHAGGGL